MKPESSNSRVIANKCLRNLVGAFRRRPDQVAAAAGCHFNPKCRGSVVMITYKNHTIMQLQVSRVINPFQL